MRLAELEPLHVAVWGAGREGRAALGALARRLPGKTVTVLCSEAEAVELKVGGSFRFSTGPPTAETLANYDVVIKSPGISPYQAPVPEAQARGVRFVSGSALWFAEHGSARTIAVTGTKGKSTTTALVAHLLRAAGRRVALAGNIGLPLLELIDPPQEPDWWVIELSSFQSRDLGAVPEIAVLLNLYPEHLDWHGGQARYYADKLRLLGEPGRRPRASVLNAQRPPPHDAVPEQGVRWFGERGGWHLRGAALFRGDREVLPLERLPLPGTHNAFNLCAALAAIEAAGEDALALAPAVAGFRPLPHRLQSLGERGGVEWVDDSIATTPHATLAALDHYKGRDIVLLVGGHDRGVDWADFVESMARQPAYAVVTMGANGPRIHEALQALPPERPRRCAAASLAEAVNWARDCCPAGGVILLSPGAPSFGEFRDYIERGRRFAALAGFDPERSSSIEGLGL